MDLSKFLLIRAVYSGGILGEMARTKTPAVAPPTTISVQPAVQPVVPASPSKIKAVINGD